ncbi:LysE family transporter [Bdellovibrio bacteriovorus]
MILWIAFLGFISAFALGPATFNIIQNLIQKRTWPWKEILGFMLGDIIYLALAISLIHTPLLQESRIKSALTFLTISFLVFYSVKILLKKKETVESALAENYGFWRSLFITLCNFHLVFIYAGLFAPFASRSGNELLWGAGSYLAAFFLSFLGLLWVLQMAQKHLERFLRKIEIIAAYGFLTFSFLLSLELL